MQAIQLVWRTVRELTSDTARLELEGARSLIPNDTIMSIVAACVQLQLCSFATPKTRFSTQRLLHHLRHLRTAACSQLLTADVSSCYQGDEASRSLHLRTCRQQQGHVADAWPLAGGRHTFVHHAPAILAEGVMTRLVRMSIRRK
jgi:hypothetical protein